jgi:signal transduction histidine kinase
VANAILLLNVDPNVVSLLMSDARGGHQVEGEADTIAMVERLRREPFRYDTLVIGDSVAEPAAILQDVAAIRRDLPAVVLCKSDKVDALKRSMQFAPFLPTSLSIELADSPDTAARAIREAAIHARRRKRYSSIVEQSSAGHGRGSEGPGLAGSYLATLMNASSGAVILLDKQKRAEQWNEQAAEILGEGALQYHRSLEGLLGTSAAGVLEEMGDSSSSQVLVESPGKSDVLMAKLLVVSARNQVSGYILCLDKPTPNDLSDAGDHDRALRHRADDLRRMNEALSRSNRELEDFAYTASHDLQEPLRKINSFTDLLRADFADVLGGDGEFYLDRLQDASARMIELIRGLLAYSRVGTADVAVRKVRLDQIARQVVSDLEVAIEEAGAIVTVKPLPLVEADPIQIRQLFQNLIGNGIKFRREGGVPRITIETLPSDDQDVVRIAVRDNGIGINEAFTEKIFAPFHRLHGRGHYEGSGMGLAICRRIAQRHAGDLSVESTEDVGSTFVITLPKTQPDRPA